MSFLNAGNQWLGPGGNSEFWDPDPEVLDLEDEEDPNYARVSQLPVEMALAGDPYARVTQLPVEVALAGDPSARVSQLPVEIALRNLRETVLVIIID